MPLLIVPLCKVSAVASDWDGWISGVCSLALHRRSISAQHTDATVSAAMLWLKAQIKRPFIIVPHRKRNTILRLKSLSLLLLRWASQHLNYRNIYLKTRLTLSIYLYTVYIIVLVIDYFSVLQEYWLIRCIEASVRSTALTLNPLPLIKGNRVNLINAY